MRGSWLLVYDIIISINYYFLGIPYRTILLMLSRYDVIPWTLCLRLQLLIGLRANTYIPPSFPPFNQLLFPSGSPDSHSHFHYSPRSLSPSPPGLIHPVTQVEHSFAIHTDVVLGQPRVLYDSGPVSTHQQPLNFRSMQTYQTRYPTLPKICALPSYNSPARKTAEGDGTKFNLTERRQSL